MKHDTYTCLMAPSSRALPVRARQRGFTILELMVASTIALFMLIGVSELYLSSLAGEKTNSASSDITANGRYAIDVLRREFMHAGFRGVSWAEPTIPLSTSLGTITNECIGSGFVSNLRQGIWGANDSNPFSATCIPTSAYSTGDVIVIRHASVATVATLNANTIYFRSAYERGEVFKGSNSATLATTFTQSPNYNYPLEVKAFYVSKYTNLASESPNVPALYKVSLGLNTAGTSPAMNAELVAANVEDMQIQYGRYTTDLNTQFYTAATVSTTATSTTTAISEWDDVSVVRIWLLVRATSVEPGYKNTSTYTLGDKTVTVNDSYRREVFTTVVQLRNNT
jgi:type IV pilus assembly protein PilW